MLSHHEGSHHVEQYIAWDSSCEDLVEAPFLEICFQNDHQRLNRGHPHNIFLNELDGFSTIFDSHRNVDPCKLRPDSQKCFYYGHSGFFQDFTVACHKVVVQEHVKQPPELPHDFIFLDWWELFSRCMDASDRSQYHHVYVTARDRQSGSL